MTTTYRLPTIQDAVAISTILSRSWFRGHSRAVDQLTPRVYRPDFRDEIVEAFRPQIELETIEAFKRDAATLSDHAIPSDDDHLGWLCLMQHYKTPTRLLDWTENALIALYFTVVADEHEDGELWAMYPQALNAVADIGFGTPLLNNNPVLNYLIREPYWAGTLETLAAECRLKKPPTRPVAFVPRRSFRRMVAQQSTFTIHPRPNAGHTIPEVLTDKRHLVRYVVPAASKFRLMQDLRSLGISDLTIWPDLEGLSRKVANDNRVIAYSPPNPPVGSGEIAATREGKPAT